MRTLILLAVLLLASQAQAWCPDINDRHLRRIDAGTAYDREIRFDNSWAGDRITIINVRRSIQWAEFYPRTCLVRGYSAYSVGEIGSSWRASTTCGVFPVAPSIRSHQPVAVTGWSMEIPPLRQAWQEVRRTMEIPDDRWWLRPPYEDDDDDEGAIDFETLADLLHDEGDDDE